MFILALFSPVLLSCPVQEVTCVNISSFIEQV